MPKVSAEGRGSAKGGVTQTKRACPKCGEAFGNLPLHLPACNGGDGSD